MPQEKKGRNPRVSKSVKTGKTPDIKIAEQPQCHIHDKVYKFEVENIRENVCVNDELLTEYDGKHYCLFHLPTKEKDNESKFEEKFRARLKDIEEKIHANEELPEEEREKNKHHISYDFRYVWFPYDVALDNYKFSASVDFESATFLSKVYLTSATFSDSAIFSYVTFSDYAYFTKAIFSDYAYFRSATFSAAANFSAATFSDKAFFKSAKFSDDTNFALTKFSKKSITDFDEVDFAQNTFFNRARFRNDVSFSAAIFGKESNIFFQRTFFAQKADFRYCLAEGYVRFSNLRQGKESKFDFQEAAFEKASRISFHTVRLFPNWFVNVDARKFVFTNIKWRNHSSEWRNKNIKAELGNLKERGIKGRNKRLLEIAIRQLAVNAEENNRYEEAARFRYMAMETKRLDIFGWRKFINLYWFYKWTSGYGERWSWAALMLVCLLLFFGVFYNSPFANFEMAEKKPASVIVKEEIEMPVQPQFYKMNNLEGFVHSLYVAALQRPEPKAADTWTKLFVILETIFAPVQTALLALAIRRKFMR